MALLQVSYLSKALFRTVPLYVILPSDKIDYRTFGYANDCSKKFKTLYLLHGLLGDCSDWVNGTRIRRWAEEKNLAVVMPSGDNAFYIDYPGTKNNYSTFIGKELVEVTRNMFPLSDKREDTYIAGLSMGGYGALRNGIVYSDTFSHVAGLSSATHLFDGKEHDAMLMDEKAIFGDMEKAAKTELNPTVAFDNLLKENRPAPKFYISCGTEDGLFDANVDFKNYLVGKGADVTWDEEKKGHDWDFWDSQIKKVLDWLPLEGENLGLGSGNVRVGKD
jgi:S-formylglutathione hydrolase FrmB